MPVPCNRIACSGSDADGSAPDEGFPIAENGCVPGERPAVERGDRSLDVSTAVVDFTVAGAP